MITAKRCAVLGSPVSHSLSPVIHRTAYEVLGLSGWTYDAFDVDADGLPTFVADCGPEWVGLSCTMPLKEAVLGLGEPSDVARLLRSGNTYLFGRDGAPAFVDNTDVAGLLDPLRASGIDRAATAVIVGAGATARSGLAALRQLGVNHVEVIARDVTRAHASLDQLAAALGVRLDVRTQPSGDRWEVALSVLPVPTPRAFADSLAARAGVVFDVQYGHGRSSYVDAAQALGVPLLDGIDMLAAQAAVQVRLMTGHECPVEPLVTAARTELARRRPS